VTTRESASPPVGSAWDEYWRLTREAAAHKGGGPQEEILARFWTSFFGDLRTQKAAPRVLDVACGNGAVTGFALTAAGSSGALADVVGIDTSLAAVRDLRARFPSALAAVCDAVKTPFADRSFDVVASQFGLEYAGVAAFDEASRLVARGGTLAAILHLRAGAIYRECGANLQAILGVQSSGVLSAARDLFRVRGPSAPGRTLAEVQRSQTKLEKALRDVEKVLRRRGEHVAGGVVRRLHVDLTRMSARAAAYNLVEVIRWIDNTARELEAYAGRMSSMLAAALDDRGLEKTVEVIERQGLSVRIRDTLEMGAVRPEPGAWVLVCDRA